MKYTVIAKIVGPYLPDFYEVSDIALVKEDSDLSGFQPATEVTSDEQFLIDRGVGHRIRFNKDKLRYRKISSPHIIKISLEEESPHQVIDLAKARIEHLVESLTIASFNIPKIHPSTGKELSKSINDIYQYQIVGVFNEEGVAVEGLNMYGTGINYFPEGFPGGLEQLMEDILSCNDPTLIKLMKYLKRAKTFSDEYYSELEVFLNSMKCIELLVNYFYPHDQRKQNGRKASFKERMKGFDANPGVVDILGIEIAYADLAINGWDARNQMDIAHASEYLNLLPYPFPDKVNYTAYHFILKYVQYLKVSNPNSFWRIGDLDEEWWEMFKY